MALYKYSQAALFTTGLNQDVDEKILQIELQKADNLVMSKIGRLECRKGFKTLPTEIHNSSSHISNGEMLQSYNNELLLLARNSLYSYSNTTESWVKRDDKLTVVNDTQPFSRSPISVFDPLYVRDNEGGGLTAYKQDGHFYYDSFERGSGLRLAKRVRIDNTVHINNLELVYDNNFFCFIYTAPNGNMYFKRCRKNTPDELSDDILLVGDAHVGNSLLKVFRYNANWLGVAYRNNNEKLTIFYFNNKGEIAGAGEGFVDKTTFNGIELIAYMDIAVKPGALPQLYITSFIAGDLDLHRINNNLQLIETHSLLNGADVFNLTSIVIEDELIILHTQPNPNERLFNIIKTSFDLNDNILVNSNMLIRGLGIASEVFSFDERLFILVSYDSLFQGCYFILDCDTGKVEGRVDYLTGAGHIQKPVKVVVEGTREFSLIAPTKTKVVRDGERFDLVTGLDFHQFIFESPRNYQALAFSDNLQIAGSIPHVYDSTSLVETGFLIYPEGLEATASEDGGELGNTTTEGDIEFVNYFYTVVYAWVDDKGNIHRSTPHEVVSVSMGAVNNTVTLDIPSLKITKKDNVNIEIYRSEANGAINHKIAAISNDTTVDFITYVDKRSDEGLITLEPLYTTGGVLENSPPRSCKYLTIFQNRLFTAGLRDNKTLQYSHEVAEGYPAEFNDLLVTTVPLEEDITAIYGLGNFLVVFTENTTGIIVGEGADVLGQRGNYRFEYLTKGEGCITLHSLLETKNGLYFQSKRGIQLLTRSGELVFIGAFVKDFQEIITSTQNISDRQELRFNTATYTLVYNEHFNVWTTFSNVGGSSTVSHRNVLYRLNPTGDAVFQESDDHSDNGAAITTKLQTGWIKASHLHNFNRIYKAAFVGIRREQHDARINVYYNYDKQLAESFNYESEDLQTWGGVSWGDLEFNYESESDLFYEVRPRKQKCSAIAFEIESLHKENQPTPGFSLTGIAFVIGLKRNLRKDSGSKRAKPTT